MWNANLLIGILRNPPLWGGLFTRHPAHGTCNYSPADLLIGIKINDAEGINKQGWKPDRQ